LVLVAVWVGETERRERREIFSDDRHGKEGAEEGMEEGKEGRTIPAFDVGIRQFHDGNDARCADLVRAVIRLKHRHMYIYINIFVCSERKIKKE